MINERAFPKLEPLLSSFSLLTSAAPSCKARLFWLDCDSSQNYSCLVSSMKMFTQTLALRDPSDGQPWWTISWSLGVLSLTSPWLLLETAKQPKQQILCLILCPPPLSISIQPVCGQWRLWWFELEVSPLQVATPSPELSLCYCRITCVCLSPFLWLYTIY